ncbi:MAG: NAD(P)-dependent oxidoreductase [Solirubrobacteraceae bacterium]
MPPRVLVKEKIGEPGVARLREAGLEVDLGLDWSDGELGERIGAYEGILIRSATMVTADLIERAGRLRVIGRAGVGVDNVDVPAATKRGIVVANAPQSNVVTAAEHTMALLLALARNIPQADASLRAGRWDRSKFSGVELYDKTLGIVGFGRIGQLVAERARGFGMRVVAYDPYVGGERYADLGVERAESSDELYARADFVTIHLPNTPETEGWLDAEAFAKMRDGVRVLNVARGPLVVDEDLRAALDSGKVGGAALDVFRTEPITDHPLFGYPNVIVTPHLGASTAEATDRAGEQAAEQVVAALTGGVVSTAVNIPAIPAEDWEAVGPFLPLCEQLGRIGAALAAHPGPPAAIPAGSEGGRVSRPAGSIDRVEVEFLGRIAERDDRLLTIAVLNGVLAGHTEEEVNYVNAPAMADERGIRVAETKEPRARDFTDLVRVTVEGGGARERVVGTVFGSRHRPHLLEAWGQRFNVQLDPHLALFRYQDVPGMIGRVGTVFGDHGVNIVSAAVGRLPGDDEGERDGLAVMVLTTDVAVPNEVVAEIVQSDGFVDGRTVSL